MPLELVPFGGLASLEADELVPLDRSITAADCYLDDDTISPRNGYRAATASALVVSGTPQGLWRFRPSASSARSIAAIAGQLFSVTDPSSETASDGVAASIATPFASNALLSGAQLGSYFYIATDENNVAWRRIASDFSSLSSLDSLPKPAAPATALGSLSLTSFSSGTITATNCTNTSNTPSPWKVYQCTTAGGTVEVNLGADQNWSGANWLFVSLATAAYRGTNPQVVVEVATSAGSWEALATVQDAGNPSTGPSCAYLPLSGLTSATRAAVRKIRFRALQTGFFAIAQWLAIPTAPASGEVEYYVTGYNTSTGQESALSPVTRVTYNNGSTNIPKAQLAGFYGNTDSFLDQGIQAIDPDILGAELVWNKTVGKATPTLNDFASVATFTGSVGGSANRARLYRQTINGLRLVKEVTLSSGNYTIVDDQGDIVLANAPYRPGGTPPRATCLTARAQRLIAAYENRIYISSYLATSDNSANFPQFPDIAQEDADGWSFDIAPSNAEQVQGLVNGDALYILTNERVNVMNDLTPGSLYETVSDRGALGRRAFCWAENMLFLASWDGVYAIQNRAEPTELSQSIRRLYREWLAPGSTAVVTYQSRKLYIWSGLRYVRYDFVRGVWTQGTVAHTIQHAAGWRDPSGTVQQMWLLTSDRQIMRWQPGYAVGAASAASTDAGSAIPAWEYETGFAFAPVKTQPRSFFLDATGPVQLSLHSSAEDKRQRIKECPTGEHQLPGFGDLAAYKWRIKLRGIGGATVRRLLWERIPIDGDGG